MFSTLLRSSFRTPLSAAALCSVPALCAFRNSNQNDTACEAGNVEIARGYKRPSDPARTVKDFNEQWHEWAYAKSATLDPVLASTLAKYEGSDRWSRIDDVSVKRKGDAYGLRGQAIRDSLAIRAGALPAYRMYLRDDGEELVLVVQCSNGTSGHTNILHGGISALLFDESMGWMAGAARMRDANLLHIMKDPTLTPNADDMKQIYQAVGFTAFLHVNYRRPVGLKAPQGGGVLVLSVTDDKKKSTGRKLFLKAKLCSADGSVHYADSEALYISPRPR